MQVHVTNLEKPWESKIFHHMQMMGSDTFREVGQSWDIPYNSYAIGFYIPHYIERYRIENGVEFEK